MYTVAHKCGIKGFLLVFYSTNQILYHDSIHPLLTAYSIVGVSGSKRFQDEIVFIKLFIFSSVEIT